MCFGNPIHAKHIFFSISFSVSSWVRMRRKIPTLSGVLVHIQKVVVVALGSLYPPLLACKVTIEFLPHVFLCQLVGWVQKPPSKGPSSLGVGWCCAWMLQLSTCRSTTPLHAAESLVLRRIAIVDSLFPSLRIVFVFKWIVLRLVISSLSLLSRTILTGDPFEVSIEGSVIGQILILFHRKFSRESV